MPPHDIDLVLPCLDEREALAWVLERVPAGVRPLVVDNGSTDGSGRLARRLGATVVEAPQRGYGAACDAGLRAARADVVAFCDCDASIDPVVVPSLAARLDEVDLVVARRRPVSARAFPAPARVANAVLARRLRRRTGVDLRDLGPLRVARREALLRLDVRDRRSGYPVETVVRAAAAGWRVVGADVDYLERRGHSKVTGTPLGYWRAVRDASAVLAP